MDRGLLVGLCLLCCLSAGDAVTCYYCTIGLCFVPTTETCSFGEICNTATPTYGMVGFNGVKKHCLSIMNCLSTSTEFYDGGEVSFSNSCCFGSLCNAGSLMKPSLLAGLLTLMAALLMKFL
ncbi:uncharacterized protein LOC144756303 [Lissotriton helveticus]